jgi:YVTN family beta-propeller protein
VNLLTRRVYAANAGDNTISVIDERTNTVIANVPAAGLHVAVDELRNRTYSCSIGRFGFSLLSIINGKNNGVLATVTLAGASCGELAVDTFRNRIYVTDDNADSVIVISGPRRR